MRVVHTLFRASLETERNMLAHSFDVVTASAYSLELRERANCAAPPSDQRQPDTVFIPSPERHSQFSEE